MNLDAYIKLVAEQINQEDGINESVKYKQYDWDLDFKFTPDVINELREKDLFWIDPDGIYVMVPVNRENAPNYFSPDHFNYRKNPDGSWKDGKEPDFEPYNILHISIKIDTKNKTLNIERYFGHRDDWDGENATSTEKDWSDIPVLSKATVQSLIDAYNDNGVFEKLLANINEYTQKHNDYLDNYVGEPHKRAEQLKSYGKYTDDEIQKKIDRLIRARKNRKTIYSKWIECCEAIISGEFKSYSWKWDFPEEPSKEMIEKRYKEHSEYSDGVKKELTDYYSTDGYKGD